MAKYFSISLPWNPMFTAEAVLRLEMIFVEPVNTKESYVYCGSGIETFP